MVAEEAREGASAGVESGISKKLEEVDIAAESFRHNPAFRRLCILRTTPKKDAARLGTAERHWPGKLNTRNNRSFALIANQLAASLFFGQQALQLNGIQPEKIFAQPVFTHAYHRKASLLKQR